MSRRAGLKRGLDDIPSQKASASEVLSRISSSAGPARRVTRLRVVEPEPVSARATPKRNRPAGRRATPRRPGPIAPEAPEAGAPPPPPPPGRAKAAPFPADAIRGFYEILGREVSRVFMDTMRQVVSAGFGIEEVIPQVFSKLFRAYGGLPGRMCDRLADIVRSGLKNELLDPDTWRGAAYLLRSTAEMELESYRRRRAGDYEVDEFGLDEEFLYRVLPILRFLYEKWWRVTATGLEHVPDKGRALLVGNHSGVLPYDGAMIATAVYDHHPHPRLMRALHLEWFVSVPFVAPFLQRAGQVLANHENGERLLRRDHLVAVFPEGLKGVGKHFRDRYQLARFGRGGFIKMAIRARAPIIPVSVVGAEEIHPVLFHLDFIAKPLGMPYLPVSPTFPLLGPLGLIPLPSKWLIHFGEPIDMSVYEPDDANDFHLVSQLSDHVRSIVQKNIHDLLQRRRSVFG